MGCSSSNPPGINDSSNLNKNVNETSNLDNNNYNDNDLSSNENYYHTYKFKEQGVPNSNLLLFTTINCSNSDFFSRSEKAKERAEKLSFKSSSHSIALGYKKGYKLEFSNQDKFFILLDGKMETYCLIDGHGPFGNAVAQIIQDQIFKKITALKRDEFEIDYEKILNQIFNSVNEVILSRNDKDDEYGQYDAVLSGAAITLVIRYKNKIYCANVGNVLALLFNYDKLMPSKNLINEMTGNDSNFSEQILNNEWVGINDMGIVKELGNKSNLNNSSNLGAFNKRNQEDNANEMNMNYLIDPSQILKEIRRIYENGGEMKKLQGEAKSRIFVKGKYFPGLINTRSLGDQIGKGIGILSNPHISTVTLNQENNNFLLLCTDGISNSCSSDKIISMLNTNESCKLIYLNLYFSTS